MRGILPDRTAGENQFQVLIGSRAYRWIAFRLPAAAWLAPFLWLPGAACLRERVYRRVAAHLTGACAVPRVLR